MGRKPNPIVSKYFTRGAKIEDASNRYQYTCKQCGERFPKGRIDSLYTHITKKCTALSFQAKKDLVLQIHDQALAADAASATKNKSTVEKTETSHQQNTNSLDVLAEASQQHSYPTPYPASYPLPYPPTFTVRDSNGNRKSIVLDPALENETFSSTPLHEKENHESGRKLRESFDAPLATARLTLAGTSSSGPTSIAVVPALPDSVRRAIDDASPSTASHINDLQIQATSASSRSASLRSIAASANASLANAAIPKVPNFIPSGSRVTMTGTGQQASSWPPATTAVNETSYPGHDKQLIKQQLAPIYPRPIEKDPPQAAKDLPSESSQESSDQKPKGRAQFTEARKKEIKKMRQIGSCIRCKMLKKPCSASTPCITCSAIDSPRTWKGFQCLRAKLVDLYQGYVVGLCQTISSQEINVLKSDLHVVHDPCKLSVRYFADADSIELGALISSMESSEIGPSLSSVQNKHGPAAKTVILDNEMNDLPTIFEEYIQKESAHFFEQEVSPIVKSAAMRVHQYGQDSDDVLLKTVVDLWMLTTMISDPTKVWSILVLQDVPEGSCETNRSRAAAGTSINEQTDQQSYALLCSQLQRGLERLATKLSTHALNKFEQQLLRPVSLNQFEAFLIAIILINCVERHSWIFHKWTDQSKAEPRPLKDSPADMISQAEQVTNVIAFMITIRNLTPRITETTAGGVLQAEHPNDEKYAKWFEEIGATVDLLAQRRENAVFDLGDCRSLDLQYSATLLLPSHNVQNA
jgi:hypothetical protein